MWDVLKGIIALAALFVFGMFELLGLKESMDQTKHLEDKFFN